MKRRHGALVVVACLLLVASIVGVGLVAGLAAGAGTDADGSATSYVAPAEAGDLDSLAAIQAARANGTLTERAGAARRDTVAVRLRLPGIADAVAAQDGPNATARFRALLERDAASLDSEFLSRTTHGPYVFLNATRPAALTVVPGDGSDVLWLVYDTEHLTGIADEDFDGNVSGDPVETTLVGDQWRITVAYGGANASFELGYGDRDAHLDTNGNGVLVGESGEPLTVTGTTGLAPGTTLLVNLTLPNGTTHTTRTSVAAEGGHGDFRATFETTSLPRSFEARVTVSTPVDDGPVGDVSVVVEPPAGSLAQTAAVRMGNQIRVTGLADLSHGGVVAVVDRDTERVVATSDPFFAGQSSRFAVTFWAGEETSGGDLAVVLLRDQGRDASYSYDDPRYDLADGPDVVDVPPAPDANATTTSATTSATGTDRTTGATSRTSVPIPSVTDAGPSPSPTPTTPTPGFGPLATAAALAALLALARRRR